MQNHKKTVNRTEALGLKTAKFHQTRHIVDCILRFGSPENINSARNENHHIDNTKKPARTTQRRCDVLAEQTAVRCYHKHVLDLAKHCVDENDACFAPSKPKPETFSGTKCKLEVVCTGIDQTQHSVTFGSNKPCHIHCSLANFIGENMLDDKIGTSITIGTEINILQDVLFRDHPSCRSKRPWHDFCCFQTNQMQHQRIAKSWCFVEARDHWNLMLAFAPLQLVQLDLPNSIQCC